ncbi:UNVERIFIED_CONTAM: hypothetical protein RMT77_014684 [Armadillidium vulgare]
MKSLWVFLVFICVVSCRDLKEDVDWGALEDKEGVFRNLKEDVDWGVLEYIDGSVLEDKEGSVLEDKEGSVLEDKEWSVLEDKEGSVLEDKEGSVLKDKEGSALEDKKGNVLEDKDGSVLEDKEWSVLEDKGALDLDPFMESDSKFPDEQWQDLDLKDSEISPELREFLFWNFNSIPNNDLESEQKENDPFYKNSFEVSEEKSDIYSPFFLIEDDEMNLMKEKPSDFESENSDESAEKYENDDWLYSDYADILNILKKQEEGKNTADKDVAMEILPSLEIYEENNGKLSEEKVNDDWLFPLGNNYDYFADKLSEEKSDMDYSSNKNSNMDDIQLPSLTFDQILKMVEDDAKKIKDDKLPDEKEADDWMQFPFVNDYDYFVNKLDKKNMETINENPDIEVTLWTKTKNKITIRVISLDDNDLVGNPEIVDEKKGPEWDTFPERKYIGSYEYTENDDYDNGVLTRRYFGRSSMFMISTIIVVFSVMIFGFCLLCKIFNSKKKVLKLCNKQDSSYQPLNEEVV